jgi:hypothetical protein
MTEQELENLRRGVILSGQLSEIHVKTLKMLPFIFFDEVETVEIDYDIKTIKDEPVRGLDPIYNDSSIKFTISFKDLEKTDTTYDIDLLDKRLHALTKSVHTLLWPQVSIVVQTDNGIELNV